MASAWFRYDGGDEVCSRICELGGWVRACANVPFRVAQRTLLELGEMSAYDAVDGAHSAASKCHRVVALEQTTLRGAVHGRG